MKNIIVKQMITKISSIIGPKNMKGIGQWSYHHMTTPIEETQSCSLGVPQAY